MDDTPVSEKITIKPKTGAVVFAMLLFGGMLAFLLYVFAGGLWRTTSSADFGVDLVVVAVLLAYGCLLIDQITCYAQIDAEQITRLSPFHKWRLSLRDINSTLIVRGARALSFPSLVVRTQKQHISFQQLALSRKDLQRIQSELRQRCAAIGVNVQTEPPPLVVPVKTIVKWGWFYLLGICIFIAALVWMGLHRVH